MFSLVAARTSHEIHNYLPPKVLGSIALIAAGLALSKGASTANGLTKKNLFTYFSAGSSVSLGTILLIRYVSSVAVGPRGDLQGWVHHKVEAEKWDESLVDQIKDPFVDGKQSIEDYRVVSPQFFVGLQQTPHTWMSEPPFLAATQTSTYDTSAYLSLRGALGGSLANFWAWVNADFYRVLHDNTGNHNIVCVCDGVGHGNHPASAAETATDGFVRYIKNRFTVVREWTSESVNQLLYEALQCAHYGAVSQMPLAGKGEHAATLLGGVMFPLQDEIGGASHLFTAISQGDCCLYVMREEQPGSWKVVDLEMEVNSIKGDHWQELHPYTKEGQMVEVWSKGKKTGEEPISEEELSSRREQAKNAKRDVRSPGGAVGVPTGPLNSKSEGSRFNPPKICHLLLKKGDVVVMGSDGLGDNMDVAAFTDKLKVIDENHPASIRDALLEHVAQNKAKPDHTTVVVFKVGD